VEAGRNDVQSDSRRFTRIAKNLPNWRIVRYADDFVVLVRGDRHHVEALRTEIREALAPLGLRVSQSKTRVVHMADGFDFLGFHVNWTRTRTDLLATPELPIGVSRQPRLTLTARWPTSGRLAPH
jgi:hypothetical protein